MTVASPPAVSRRAPRLLFALTLAWLLAALALADPRAVGLFHDDGLYISAAESLASGHGYRIPSLPGTPWQTKYPALFPALLVPIWKLFPGFPANALAFQGLVALCGAALIPLTYLVARRLLTLGEGAALAAALLVASSSWLLGLTRWVLTELPYAVITMAVLIWCERAFAGDRRVATGQALLAGAGAAVGCLLKAQGLALPAAVMVLLVGRRQWRSAASFLAGWLPLPAATLGWRWAHPNPGVSRLLDYYLSYDSSMFHLGAPGGVVAAAAATVHNLSTALVYFGSFLALPEAIPPAVRVALVATLVLAGLALAWRRGARLAALYFLFFFVSTLVVPWDPLRYLVPLLPLLVAFSVLVFETAAPRLVALLATPARVAGDAAAGVRHLRFLRGAALTTALAAQGITLGHEALTYQRASIPGYTQWSATWHDWQGFAETIDWLRAHTRPEDVVASPLDPFYYLHTGRRGLRYWLHNPSTYFYPDAAHAEPRLGTVAEIAPELRRLGVRWLIREPVLTEFYAESCAADELAQELAASPLTGARLVFRSHDAGHFIYRLDWPSLPTREEKEGQAPISR